MANLKQLRIRIKSIKSTGKITKAMQLVSATKLNKIKHELGDAAGYLEGISNLISHLATDDLLHDLPDNLHKYFVQNDGKILLVIFTSEKGLCGSFNAGIIKNTKNDIEKLRQIGRDVRLMIIGHKGYNLLKAQYKDMIINYFPFDKENDKLFTLVKGSIIEMLDKGEISECYLYFNKFKNAMTQFFTKQQILPVTGIVNKQADNLINYEYEGKDLVEKIINLYLDSQINAALLQTRAGEEGARMTAMDNATKNANHLVDDLTVKLNRTRQAAITNDLIEIIAGAEAI